MLNWPTLHAPTALIYIYIYIKVNEYLNLNGVPGVIVLNASITSKNIANLFMNH